MLEIYTTIRTYMALPKAQEMKMVKIHHYNNDKIIAPLSILNEVEWGYLECLYKAG